MSTLTITPASSFHLVLYAVRHRATGIPCPIDADRRSIAWIVGDITTDARVAERARLHNASLLRRATADSLERVRCASKNGGVHFRAFEIPRRASSGPQEA